ncbi:hypothetical protein [Streptomyces sp. NPDC050988]|uniref:hypothetical protein n=1 Tax=Streptomyces sp. NPDC050988 TaxID=3365637 RepID=UPI0037AEE175
MTTSWWMFGLGVATGVLGTGVSGASHVLALKKDRRELAEKLKAEQAQQLRDVAEASLVTVTVRGSGGSVAVKITNDGDQPVLRVELLDIRREGADPAETWSVNQNMVPQPAVMREVLKTHTALQVATWLLDADGKRMSVPRAVEYAVRFCDVSGQWWLRDASDAPPRPIEAP